MADKPAMTSDVETSPIENEIATYRAIHPLAIFALMAGAAAALSFINLVFLAAAVVAVLAGALAIRKIRATPDIYTGANFARAGIALGIVCGLAAVTTTFTQQWVIEREATKFAREYIPILAGDDLDKAVWYRFEPSTRAQGDPKLIFDKMKQEERSPFMMMAQPIEGIRKHLQATSPDAIELDDVESTGVSELTPFALVRLRLHGSGKEGEGAEDRYALLALKANTKAGKYEWWISDIVFPYTRHTAKVEEEHAGDDHGHSHGS